jgi:hypothetical protein
MSMGRIYQLYGPDKKLYIGSTISQLYDRLASHKAFANGSRCSKVYQHMRKLGPDEFVIREICVVPQEYLLDVEIYYIHRYKPELNTEYNSARSQKLRKKERRARNHQMLTDEVPPLTIFTPRQTARRKKTYWTSAEEDALRKGVESFGAQWSCILRKLRSSFHTQRTSTDLKDKWRTLRLAV